jgi:alpha-tubulin suppressor-like RCC1 family protein
MKRAIFLAGLALLSSLGCRSDVDAPTEPSTSLQERTTPEALLAFTQVSAGQQHSCGITTDNRVYCWGSGTLGDGSPSPEFHYTPVAVAGAVRFRQVSAGQVHTCGVALDYRAYCWGNNLAGELGDGTITERLTPKLVAGGLTFRQVSAGFTQTCGVAYADRLAYCWGDNDHGQLGDGTTATRLRPTRVAGGRHFHQVSTETWHTCGVTTDGDAYCWGYNYSGQLGDSTQVLRRLRPTRVVGTRKYRQVDVGSSHTCAVSITDRAFCWGNGRFGAIGNGHAYYSYWPRLVSGVLRFDRVTAGGGHSCGESTTNQAYCWGWNDSGQLGDGTTTLYQLTPMPVVGGLRFSQLSAGTWHTCGKSAAGILYCWGNNGSGQLGDGTQINRPAPTMVAGSM